MTQQAFANGSLRHSTWLMATTLSTLPALLLLRQPGLAAALRLALVLMPLLCGAAWVWAILAAVRRADELDRRVLMEAAAIGCLATFLVAVLYPLLQTAGVVGPLRVYYIGPFLAGTFILGCLSAVRRYR